MEFNDPKFLGYFETPPENPTPGYWYIDSEGKSWVCNINGTEWLEFERLPDGNINTGLTNYDLNKMVVSQLPSKTTNGQLKEYKEILKILGEQANYFMLLCNDIHYYTVIQRTGGHNNPTFYNTIIELLQERGEIKLIDWDSAQQAIECWIQNDEGVFMFLLFPYDWGIVECE